MDSDRRVAAGFQGFPSCFEAVGAPLLRLFARAGSDAANAIISTPRAVSAVPTGLGSFFLPASDAALKRRSSTNNPGKTFATSDGPDTRVEERPKSLS